MSPFIEQVLQDKHLFKLASREFRQGESSEVIVSTPNRIVTFGQNSPLVHVSGFCLVENESMIVETAQRAKVAGAQFLRWGAYKPCTSSDSFQEYSRKTLDLLSMTRQETGLGIITEVIDTTHLDKISALADIIQVGTRNMYNFSLLKEVGKRNKPVLLERGISATIEEWLIAAEYILVEGNSNVILCERGIRTFESKYTRNILDLAVVPVLRSLTHLPIAIDPSHGTGKSEYVPAMAIAAIAAGADSIMIEVHHNLAKALSDEPQSLTPEQYEELMQQMNNISRVVRHTADSSFSPTLTSKISVQNSTQKTTCIPQ